MTGEQTLVPATRRLDLSGKHLVLTALLGPSSAANADDWKSTRLRGWLRFGNACCWRHSTAANGPHESP